ncbi:MAG: hypothetical protein LBR83_06665 [Clostridiales bacterium]|jgi:hypothetical protein|nr:hypothetical protein [Clostridiales bacterium]
MLNRFKIYAVVFLTALFIAFAPPAEVSASAGELADALRTAIENMDGSLTVYEDADFDLDAFVEEFDFAGVSKWELNSARSQRDLRMVWDFAYNEVYAIRKALEDASFEQKLSPRQAQVLSECRAFVKKNIPDKLTDYEKEKLIHDYLCVNVSFDEETEEERLSGIISDDITPYTAYGALFNGTAVCEGYANAAWVLLTLSGVENHIVNSDTHAWNLVKLGSRYCHLDVTWDSSETDLTGTIQYTYFNLTDEQMTRYPEHQPVNAGLPPADSEAYNMYFNSGMRAGNLADVERIITAACEAGERNISLWVDDHLTFDYDWQRDLQFVWDLTPGGNYVESFMFVEPGADRDTLTVILYMR